MLIGFVKSNPDPGRVIETVVSENVNPVLVNKIQRSNVSMINNDVDLNNNTAQIVVNPFSSLIPSDNDLLSSETMFTQIKETQKKNGPINQNLISKKENKLFSFLKTVESARYY